MSVIGHSALVGAAGNQGGYTVGRSLRFRSSASAYLSRTFGSNGSQQTWTWSGWVKAGRFGSQQPLFCAYSNTTNYGLFTFSANAFISATDTLKFYTTVSNVSQAALETAAVFRDPSAWYHIVLQIDTTQATANNRVRIYVNGVQQTLSGTQPSQNTNLGFYNTTSVPQQIGALASGTYGYFDGYLAEVNFIDGQALTPSSFGAYDTNGVWQPKKYTGTYGTNGFYLPFSNTTSTTTLVQDSSGNGNNWTANNISLTAGTTYDSMIDSPTNAAGTSTGIGIGNYCVLNPVAPNPSTTASTITDGNLTASASAANTMRKATMSITSGAWYFEATLGSTIQGLGLGEAAVNSFGTNSSTVGARTYYMYNTSTLYTILPGADTGITGGIGANGTLAVAVDMTNKKLWLGYASSGAGSITWIGGGSPSSGTTPTYTLTNETELFPLALTNGPSLYTNFGQRPFTYTPPSDYKALNTYNLPAPSIANGAQYMAATTYTGTGSSQTISNASNNTIGTTFQPDFVWIKSRSGAYNHSLYDVVRGINASPGSPGLFSNLTNAESVSTNTVSALLSNGFTISGTANTLNASATTYVAWQWKGGGTGVTNNSGTITSTVSASPSSGFSIATYTGTGANATVGHGLGVAPSMIIVKQRNNTLAHDWQVYHTSIGATKAIQLNQTSAASTASAVYWNNTAPTSSVFSVGTGGSVNESGKDQLAYCFSAVRGYSAFGSYTGNGLADGPFIYTGFRPRFILVKDSSAIQNWRLFDSSRSTYNAVLEGLFPNLSNAESSAETGPDFLSNGFKIRTSSNTHNASGNTIIYAAFAENPFNYSRAR